MTGSSPIRRPMVLAFLTLPSCLPACGDPTGGPGREPAGREEVPPGVIALRDLEYARIDGRPLKLDLYLPPAGNTPAPVIVWIHGGAWRAGNKNRCRALYLASDGFAVASIQYRLSTEAIFPAQIHDCKAAIRFLRARAAGFGLDPTRIGVWGGSAGGHLAALLGTTGGMAGLEGDVGGHTAQSSRVQAVVDFCGPSLLAEDQLGHVRPERADQARGAVEALLGGDPREKQALARLASPALHASPDDAPFLIVHGRQDPLVPLRQSEILAEALRAAGVPVCLHVLEDQGHGIPLDDDLRERIRAFFRSHLRGPASAPVPAPAPATATEH
mgnify:CR=1 FL=1